MKNYFDNREKDKRGVKTHRDGVRRKGRRIGKTLKSNKDIFFQLAFIIGGLLLIYFLVIVGIKKTGILKDYPGLDQVFPRKDFFHDDRPSILPEP